MNSYEQVLICSLHKLHRTYFKNLTKSIVVIWVSTGLQADEHVLYMGSYGQVLISA